MDELDDWQLWEKYPQYRWTFNKLSISLKLGYKCGPVPVPVPKTGEYVLRPIYNLTGMGIGANIFTLTQGELVRWHPGYFWCERLKGDQHSVDYIWHNNMWQPTHTSVGVNTPDNLIQFKYWLKVPYPNFTLPHWINELWEVGKLNIEFIGGKIIELHLRHGYDFPPGAQKIIPVWKSTPKEQHNHYVKSGYKFREDPEDGDGLLPDPRLGFYYM